MYTFAYFYAVGTKSLIQIKQIVEIKDEERQDKSRIMKITQLKNLNAVFNMKLKILKPKY